MQMISVSMQLFEDEETLADELQASNFDKKTAALLKVLQGAASGEILDPASFLPIIFKVRKKVKQKHKINPPSELPWQRDNPEDCSPSRLSCNTDSRFGNN